MVGTCHPGATMLSITHAFDDSRRQGRIGTANKGNIAPAWTESSRMNPRLRYSQLAQAVPCERTTPFIPKSIATADVFCDPVA